MLLIVTNSYKMKNPDELKYLKNVKFLKVFFINDGTETSKGKLFFLF